MKKLLLLGSVFLGIIISTTAQSTPYVSLSYFSSDAKQLEIQTPTSGIQPAFLGMKLTAGYRLTTNDCTVELELVPNKTIIKVNKHTVLNITSLIGLNNGTTNEFGVTEGKIRVVAAKLPAGTTASYVFKTKNSVAGVRGTDFGLDAGEAGSKAILVVKEGIVDYTKTDSNEKLTLSGGMMADAFASSFATNQLNPEEMANFFSDLNFDQLKPAQVPGNTGSKSTASSGSETSSDSNQTDPNASSQSTEESDKVLAGIFDFIGLEIGSVVLDGNTYGKAVLQPKIDTPEFKIGFYLPVIYKDNLFDASTWHHPNGNNEWSFGTDQNGDVLPIIADIWNDLILKIKYVEIGNDSTDFSLQFGNLSSMSLGHGALINEYANDAEFPAVRRSGLKIGLNPKELGLQLLVGDLGQPDLIGFRYVIKPAPELNIGLGVGLAADLNPDRIIPKNTLVSKLQMVRDLDPIISGLSFDFELPLEILGAKLMPYADLGFLMPILQKSGYTLEPGLQLQSAIDVFTLRNYGWFVGLKGEIPLIVTNLDFKAQFEFENGAYKIGYFNHNYDRTRADQAGNLIQSLISMSTNPIFESPTLGIHGELGAEIFSLLRLGGGYTWPWMLKNGEFLRGDADEFGLSLGFLKDKLPFGIGFKVEYIRSHFRELFYDKNFSMFDQYTTLRGGLSLPVGKFFKLKLTVGTATKKDALGAVVLDSNGNPTIYPTFSILTAIGGSDN